jgi:hypothetical protein
MKPLTLISIIFLFFLQTIKSQDSLHAVSTQDPATRSAIYKTFIFRFHQSTVTGYLANINDSSVFVSAGKAPLNFDLPQADYLDKYAYRYIRKVVIRKSGIMGESIVLGAVIGIVVGALIGYASGDDTGWFALSASDKALVGGVIGAGAGTVIGASIAKSSEKKFLINGEWKSLEDMKNMLQAGSR